jgi:hypothetical protein
LRAGATGGRSSKEWRQSEIELVKQETASPAVALTAASGTAGVNQN